MRLIFFCAMDKGKNSSDIFEENRSIGAMAKSEEIQHENYSIELGNVIVALVFLYFVC